MSIEHLAWVGVQGALSEKKKVHVVVVFLFLSLASGGIHLCMTRLVLFWIPNNLRDQIRSTSIGTLLERAEGERWMALLF